ncbi:flavodoxin family protein [Nocardia sp. NEAU-G5]|uniref:Flavodoxin family protein n=1 Tax=Nocardia albiluteola TaxID=2842303 RepID=A0ABS6AQ25_9NOCA|nr:flavodoxin family protein [Nocardia albiluteola]MBU3060008.1 flavodoxin family protein [Nocardia albiluteola]
MKAVIVCRSVSHGNTRKVADVIGEVLGARVVDPAEIDATELSSCDVVGFGSGVRNMAFYPELLQFARSLPGEQRRRAFVFNTSGLPETPLRRYRRDFVGLLEQKGFEVVDTFSCFGFDTFLPLLIVGGVRKGRPNAADLDAARAFAEGLRARIDGAS